MTHFQHRESSIALRRSVDLTKPRTCDLYSVKKARGDAVSPTFPDAFQYARQDSNDSSKPLEKQGFQHIASQGGAHGGALAGLQQVIDAWPTLDQATRNKILRLTEAIRSADLSRSTG